MTPVRHGISSAALLCSRQRERSSQTTLTKSTERELAVAVNPFPAKENIMLEVFPFEEKGEEMFGGGSSKKKI